MGHNMHLSKDSSVLRFGPTSGDPSSSMWPSLGTAVAERLPVYSIWMLYDHGTSAIPSMSESIVTIPSHPDRIEHLLAQIGSVFVLPLEDADRRSTWIDEERNFVQNGDYAGGLLRRHADAIFFVNEVHVVGHS